MISHPEVVIDSHQHVFWHGRDENGLVQDMEEHGITKAWLLGWEIAPEEFVPGHNQWLNPRNRRDDGTNRGIVLDDLLRARDRYPDRFEIGYCPHPLSKEPGEALRHAVRMYDVKVCGEWKFRVLIDDPRCIELFRAAGECGLPVVLHLDVPWLPDANGIPAYRSVWYGGRHDNLRNVLAACPNTRFIGHAAGFWRGISADHETDPAMLPPGPVKAPGPVQRLLEEFPNLFADLSAGSGLNALRRDPLHARQFLERYADRLLFGRDIYGSELQDFLRTLTLSSETSRRIFSDNAKQLISC
jgi:predicted TIM-barrel fold metal-dependent hydrolase